MTATTFPASPDPRQVVDAPLRRPQWLRALSIGRYPRRWRVPTWGLPVGVAALIVAWAVVALVAEPARVHVAMPRAQLGIDVGLAAIQMCCALVLILFIDEAGGQQRLRWIAAGFVILGLGAGVFGYILPLIHGPLGLEASLDSSLVMLTVADAFFVLGLLPGPMPRFRPRLFFVGLVAFALFSVVAVAGEGWQPSLVGAEGANIRHVSDVTWQELTAWHMLLFVVPVALAAIAAGGAVVRQVRSGALPNWLVIAMVMFAGAHLHHFLWPTTYYPGLTSTNLLWIISAVVVAVGGTLELRRVANERTALLSVHQENARRLEELAKLRADFSEIVAHELVAPIAAIRNLADMLATGEPEPAERTYALAAIRTEAGTLDHLVADVRLAAAAERDDFIIRPRPIPIFELLGKAAAYNRVLPGDHPLIETVTTSDRVLADPERIGQVMRNLLGNAAKYSPQGTAIEVRVMPRGERIRIEVADQGPGIDPADLRRIFEKFGRGRNALGERVPGLGLGLYLSRRIVRMHGSELTVATESGRGATFGFELEVVP